MAVRDQGTGTPLENCCSSHLQNLALKLKLKKEKGSQERGGEEVGEERTHQLLSTRIQATSKIRFHIRTLLRVSQTISEYRIAHFPSENKTWKHSYC